MKEKPQRPGKRGGMPTKGGKTGRALPKLSKKKGKRIFQKTSGGKFEKGENLIKSPKKEGKTEGVEERRGAGVEEVKITKRAAW